MNASRFVSTLVAVPLLIVAAGANAQSKADAAASDAKKPAAATAAPAAKKAGSSTAAPSSSKAVDSKSVTPATLRNKPAGSDAYPSDCHHSAKESDA